MGRGGGWRATMGVSLTILLTAILLLGLVRRERRGVANIGFEGVAVLLFYVAGVAILAAWPT